MRGTCLQCPCQSQAPWDVLLRGHQEVGREPQVMDSLPRCLPGQIVLLKHIKASRVLQNLVTGAHEVGSGCGPPPCGATHA